MRITSSIRGGPYAPRPASRLHRARAALRRPLPRHRQRAADRWERSSCRIPAFYLRARAEETLLRERFGAEYEKYAREVPMLVPLP